jgi:hypothetical protein
MEMSFNFGGECVPFPVVRYVYRRDRELRKSEIIAFLRTGEIPERYPTRESNGVINEPMNAENFRQMVRRFFLKTLDIGGRPYTELRERSSGLIVQPHYMDFEERFWRGPAITCSWKYLSTGHPKSILALMLLLGRKCWYLNAVERVKAASYRIRTGRNMPIPFPGREDHC